MSAIVPLVSIGVPVNNGEQYLSFALDSLLSQTYTNIEIIICDNASTDSTQQICQTYAAKDKRIHYYRNKENLGAARNYNLTVDKANGKYFKWAAHDDVCAPSFVERCVEILEREQNVGLAYPKTMIIDKEGRFIENHEDLFNFREKEPSIRWRRFCGAPSNTNAAFGVMRTDWLRRTPRIGAFESSDLVLLAEFALLGEIVEYPERLFLRRYHELTSTAANPTKKSMAHWFDPKSQGLFTRTKRLAEYVKTLYRVRLSFYQRIVCLYYLSLYYFKPERWLRFMKDLIGIRSARN